MGASQPVWACSGGEAILDDEFADESGGWALDDRIKVDDGKLVMRLPPDTGWTTLNVSFTVTDADLCADAVWPETDPEEAEAGITFWAEDYDNRFAFGINGAGEYYLVRRVRGEWKAIVDGQHTPAIKTGPGETNTLRVNSSGKRASLFVNGTKLRDIQGQPPEEGWFFGLVGGNMGIEDELTVSFDRFRATK
jgi:hypothetical protein